MKRYAILSAVLLVVALLFARGASAAAADQPAVLALTLNQMKRGDVIVVLRGKDVLVSVEDLEAAGLRGLHGRSETIHGKPHLSLASLSPLRFAVDEEALTLALTAPAELLPSSVIDMSGGAPSDMVRRKDTSAFLNYSASLVDFTHPSGFAEAGLSLDGVLFSTTASASLESGVVRGLSSLTIDDAKSLQRWTVGDSFVSSGPLGSGLFIGGVSVSKRFSIDPYFVHQPSLGFTGSALTPSTLDVYVNGSLARHEKIAPGTFQVQNLPVTTGGGEVRYVVRDAFGQESSIISPYSMAEDQLARGESDYSYALGLRREKVGQESFDYGSPAALAHHRYGLTDAITVGGRLEAARGVVSGGSSMSMLIPHGYFSVSAAVSGGPEGAGLAGSAALGLQTRRFNFAANLQAVSDRYSTLSLDPASDRSALEASVLASISTGTRVSMGASSSLTIPRDAPPRVNAGLSLRFDFTQALRLVCTANRTIIRPDNAPGEVSAVLTYSFDHGITASAGARVSEDGPEVFAEANRPLHASTGVALRAAAAASAHPTATATAEALEKHGRYQASVLVTDKGPHLSLETSGAIVAVEGAGVFATRPVQDGFAVVRVPNVAGVHAYLDNREIGTTDADGNVFIPNLLPYYANRLRISDQDLPFDHSIEATEMLLAPPLRGGALAVFSATPVKYYRGRARIKKDGAETTPSYGDIAVGTLASSPLGKEGEFELSGIAPGRYQATITYNGATCVTSISAADGAGPIIDLGLVVCAQ